MTDLFDGPEHTTPITPEEKRDLKLSHIAFRDELDLAEQENIATAQAWAFRTRADNLLSEEFIREVHRRMLVDVWKWAGQFRTTERNLGVAPWLISTEVRKLIGDTQAQIASKAYSSDEIAVRFHHRLVWIHPFPNGNGRHARLMADLLIRQLGGEPFSWGGRSLRGDTELRAAYISALRAADGHDIAPLRHFARS